MVDAYVLLLYLVCKYIVYLNACFYATDTDTLTHTHSHTHTHRNRKNTSFLANAFLPVLPVPVTRTHHGTVMYDDLYSCQHDRTFNRATADR